VRQAAYAFFEMKRRIERQEISASTPGCIGGICAVLAVEGDALEEIKWSKSWLDRMEGHWQERAKDLLPVSAEICLAYARLGENEALALWLKRFTDPTDPGVLDPVHAALAKFQIAAGDSRASANHTHAIQSAATRDPLLAELVLHFSKQDEDLASANLLLIEGHALRADLAKKLAAKPATSEVLLHHCVVAAGESPQALADLISALPPSSRSELVIELSKRLQTDRKAMLLKVADQLRRQADTLSAQALRDNQQ
jgi:hypothetical protein